MAARTGWIRVSTPTETSTAPTTGMSFHAHASGIPRIAKYGSHAALVMRPKAPWPMKHAATAMRRIQCRMSESDEAIDSSRSIMPYPPGRGCRTGGSVASRPTAHRPGLLLHGLQIDLCHSLADLAPEGHPVLTGAAEMDAGIDARVRALTGRLREARK